MPTPATPSSVDSAAFAVDGAWVSMGERGGFLSKAVSCIFAGQFGPSPPSSKEWTESDAAARSVRSVLAAEKTAAKALLRSGVSDPESVATRLKRTDEARMEASRVVRERFGALAVPSGPLEQTLTQTAVVEMTDAQDVVYGALSDVFAKHVHLCRKLIGAGRKVVVSVSVAGVRSVSIDYEASLPPVTKSLMKELGVTKRWLHSVWSVAEGGVKSRDETLKRQIESVDDAIANLSKKIAKNERYLRLKRAPRKPDKRSAPIWRDLAPEELAELRHRTSGMRGWLVHKQKALLALHADQERQGLPPMVLGSRHRQTAFNRLADEEKALVARLALDPKAKGGLSGRARRDAEQRLPAIAREREELRAEWERIRTGMVLYEGSAADETGGQLCSASPSDALTLRCRLHLPQQAQQLAAKRLKRAGLEFPSAPDSKATKAAEKNEWVGIQLVLPVSFVSTRERHSIARANGTAPVLAERPDRRDQTAATPLKGAEEACAANGDRPVGTRGRFHKTKADVAATPIGAETASRRQASAMARHFDVAEAVRRATTRLRQPGDARAGAVAWRFSDLGGGRLKVDCTYKRPYSHGTPGLGNGWIGVDFNDGFLAACETDRLGNPVRYATFRWDGHAASGKRRTQLAEAVKKVVEWALEAGKPIAIEQLDFDKKKRSDADKGPAYRRMLSGLPYSTFGSLMLSRSRKSGVYVHQVDPAYTSLIARFKYAGRHLSVHHAAARVIARRASGRTENPPRGDDLVFEVPWWMRAGKGSDLEAATPSEGAELPKFHRIRVDMTKIWSGIRNGVEAAKVWARLAKTLRHGGVRCSDKDPAAQAAGANAVDFDLTGADFDPAKSTPYL